MKAVIGAVILCVMVAFTGIWYFDVSLGKQKETVVTMVDAAALEIQKSGEEVFPDFRGENWRKADIYVFVWKMDGIRVVYPPDPSGEGKNMTELKDSEGKPIGKLFIETAEKGSGWVEYMWPKPNETQPSLKLTYIKRAEYQNETYLVGAGFYV